MYSQVAVVSGKGGTGKTTICAAFAAMADDAVLVDCDVDAPDLHILLHPQIVEEWDYQGLPLAAIDADACTMCGICRQACRFHAATPPTIDRIACEGCGLCAYLCPEHAIKIGPRVSGKTYWSNTRFGPLSHARLFAGEGTSGKLVTEVRKKASEIALREGRSMILIDGSPGIGCPVISTLTGVDLAVIVTEPTLTGAHDMARVVGLCRELEVPASVIVNKHDVNPDMTEQIEESCMEWGLEVLGRVPFDPVMVHSMVATQTLPEFAPHSEVTLLLARMWERIVDTINY
ncbi:MAG: 4Fe-4S binding protein [Candidatus Thorarchaeota archaeon]|nr:4Fe-4S binding protein [Candidatus Thorarchaeota archaeon]